MILTSRRVLTWAFLVDPEIPRDFRLRITVGKATAGRELGRKVIEPPGGVSAYAPQRSSAGITD